MSVLWPRDNGLGSMKAIWVGVIIPRLLIVGRRRTVVASEKSTLGEIRIIPCCNSAFRINVAVSASAVGTRLLAMPWAIRIMKILKNSQTPIEVSKDVAILRNTTEKSTASASQKAP